MDCFQTKKQDFDANNKLRNMNVKNKDFVAFTQQLVFRTNTRFVGGGSFYDRSQHYSTPKTVNSQTKIFKTHDRKPNANKKEEINEGEMQLASVTRKKIINNN